MTRYRIRVLILPLAALLTAPAAQAQAGPAHAAVSPAQSAAIRTRQAAMDEFNVRMSRLDALMGTPATRGARSRSAEAGR